MFFTNGFLGERKDLRDHLKNFMPQLKKNIEESLREIVLKCALLEYGKFGNF